MWEKRQKDRKKGRRRGGVKWSKKGNRGRREEEQGKKEEWRPLVRPITMFLFDKLGHRWEELMRGRAKTDRGACVCVWNRWNNDISNSALTLRDVKRVRYELGLSRWAYQGLGELLLELSEDGARWRNKKEGKKKKERRKEEKRIMVEEMGSSMGAQPRFWRWIRLWCESLDQHEIKHQHWKLQWHT